MAELDLDAIRADIAGARTRWEDREQAIRVLIEHGRTLVAEVGRLRGQAVGWMDEATRQAAERDKNYVQLADVRHELDVLRGINVDLDQRLDLALQEVTKALAERDQARAELERYRAAIGLVRDIHHGIVGTVCCGYAWPCETAQAVDPAELHSGEEADVPP